MKVPKIPQAIVKNKLAQNVFVSVVSRGYAQDALTLLPKSWLSLPVSGGMIIETTNHCNYKCVMCPINRGLRRPKGYMTYENFCKIIDEIKGKKDYIYMNFAGEPTLNRNVWKFARYARDNGIKSMVSTNGSMLHTFKPEEILGSGLDNLLIAIDGASPETYVKYRESVSGKNFFTDVIDNVKKLVEAKRNWEGDAPTIQVQFVVFKHNEHEVETMQKLCEDLGVDKLNIKTASYGFGSQSGVSVDRGQYTPSEDLKRPNYNRIFCYWLWKGVVLWNGDVTTCCYDYEGAHVVGNVFKDGGFWKVWNSDRFNTMRKLVLKQKPKLCQNCELTHADPGYRIVYKGQKPPAELAKARPVKSEVKTFLPVINPG